MPTGQVESPADSRADNQPICQSASGHSSGSQFNLHEGQKANLNKQAYTKRALISAAY